MKLKRSNLSVSVLAAAALLAFVLSGNGVVGTWASFTSASTLGGSSVKAGALGVHFVDDQGNLESVSRTTVANAVPLMPAQDSSFTVYNSGTVAAAVTLSAKNLNTFNGTNLDDVLQVSVKDSNGLTVYTGKVSAFTYADQAVYSPSESRKFTYEITWPSGTGDNGYENKKLQFDTVIDAVSVGNQAGAQVQPASAQSSAASLSLTGADWTVTRGQADLTGSSIHLNYGNETRLFAKHDLPNQNATITAKAAIASGMGYGIIVHATNESADSFSGLSLQFDQGAGTPKFLLRQWKQGAECSAQIAPVDVPNSIDLSVTHNINLDVAANSLILNVDGSKVYEVNDISKALNSVWCGWSAPTGTGVGIRSWGANQNISISDFTVN